MQSPPFPRYLVPPRSKYSRRRKITFKNLKKNRSHSWIGHTIGLNEFVVNILEGAIFGKKAVGRRRVSRQKHSSGQLYSNGKNGLQQFQTESCQPIKRLEEEEKEEEEEKKKKKKKKKEEEEEE